MTTNEELPTAPTPDDDKNSVSPAPAPSPTKGRAKSKDAAVAPAVVVPETPPRPAYAVYGTEERDTISLAAVKFKNLHARKSLSVKHVQRVLTERGYVEADADKDGFYGDLTRSAVADFQRDAGFPVTGLVDWETFAALFAGDPNVTLTL